MTDPKDTSEEDLEGYDEAQRAEVHEYEGGGPTDGDVLTDMKRDRGEDMDADPDPLDGFEADSPEPE